jgi:hypothetical protein
MPTKIRPNLAAPGAGLPAPELLIANMMFSLKCFTGNRRAFVAKFNEERVRIHELIESLPVTKRGEPILIARLRGLEDSSRNWSAWMTLDHLRITNLAFAHFVTELSRGRVPDMVVLTADVKPDPAVTQSVEDDYEASCDEFLDALAKAPELKSKAKLAHPWFGPLDAFRWLALASVHMGIHRAQLAAIKSGLPG